MEREVPLVLKKSVTVVAIDDPREANAIRALLEGLDYQVTVHWVGSRREFIELLAGRIRTDDMVILSCHGVAGGIHIPHEQPLSPGDPREVAKLGGKTAVSLGCMAGSLAFADAFKGAGARHYVAPTDYPEGWAALGFTANLFFLLAGGTDLRGAVEQASGFHEEMSQFFRSGSHSSGRRERRADGASTSTWCALSVGQAPRIDGLGAVADLTLAEVRRREGVWGRR